MKATLCTASLAEMSMLHLRGQVGSPQMLSEVQDKQLFASSVSSGAVLRDQADGWADEESGEEGHLDPAVLGNEQPHIAGHHA